MEDLEKLILKNIDYTNYLDEDKDIIFSMALFQALEKIKQEKDFRKLIPIALDKYSILLGKINQISTPLEFVKLFKYLELTYHFSQTSPLFPEFVLLPPSVILNTKKFLNKYNGLHRESNKMWNAGLFPFDFRIANDILDLNIDGDISKSTYLDLDYFLLVSKKRPNLFLGDKLIDNYLDEIPQLKTHKNLILNIGTLRAHKVINSNYQIDKSILSPVNYSVSTKDELLKLISSIQELSNGHGYELWFRGQPNEYKLADMKDEAKLFPYRVFRDISMPPSLYRSIHTEVVDVRTYAKKCVDLSYYSFLMSHYLDIDKADLINNVLDGDNNNSLKSYEMSLRYSIIQEDVNGDRKEQLKQYNPVTTSLTKALFLQHYGLPTNILDITNDIDVALYFAQMKVVKGSYEPVKNGNPVIYIFLLNPQKDTMLNSHELLKKTTLLRPVRQKCGILYGASIINRNHYSRFISIRIELKNTIEMNYTTDELFPKQDEDPFLDFLIDGNAMNSNTSVSPFMPIK